MASASRLKYFIDEACTGLGHHRRFHARPVSRRSALPPVESLPREFGERANGGNDCGRGGFIGHPASRERIPSLVASFQQDLVAVKSVATLWRRTAPAVALQNDRYNSGRRNTGYARRI